MNNNIKTYDTIKFFRGRKRNNAEMLRLAEAGLDFEYRRLLIEENELDLHVAFSKMLVWNWLSWSFIILSICLIQFSIISFFFFGLSLLSQVFSLKNKRFFKFVFRSYNLALSIVDAVIKNEYGMSMPRV